MHGKDGFTVSKPVNEIEGGHDELINEVDVAAAAEEKETHSFEIDPAQVIKQCFATRSHFTLLAEVGVTGVRCHCNILQYLHEIN